MSTARTVTRARTATTTMAAVRAGTKAKAKVVPESATNAEAGDTYRLSALAYFKWRRMKTEDKRRKSARISST